MAHIPYFAVYKPRLVLVFSPDFSDFTAIEAAMHGARLPVHGPLKIPKVFLRLLFQIRLIHGKIRYFNNTSYKIVSLMEADI